MSTGEADRELVTNAVSGDRVALERLLLNYYTQLSQHVAPRLPMYIQTVVNVDDILQQTFMQVFRDIGNFQPRSDLSFFAWLKTIAEHRIQDAVKELKRKKRGGDHVRLRRPEDRGTSSVVSLIEMLSADGRTASQSVARGEAIQAIQVAIASLPDDYREAIHLKYMEGRSLEEVATQMNRSPGAVRGLIDRAKQKMRAAMGRSSRWFSKR